MATMNISLPDDMKKWVDEQVASRGFMSSSEFLRDMIRREKDEFEAFRQKVLEGINSSEFIPADEISRRLDDHLKAKD